MVIKQKLQNCSRCNSCIIPQPTQSFYISTMLWVFTHLYMQKLIESQLALLLLQRKCSKDRCELILHHTHLDPLFILHFRIKDFGLLSHILWMLSEIGVAHSYAAAGLEVGMIFFIVIIILTNRKYNKTKEDVFFHLLLLVLLYWPT